MRVFVKPPNSHCTSEWHEGLLTQDQRGLTVEVNFRSPTCIRFKVCSVDSFSNPSPLPPDLDTPPVSLVVEPPKAHIAESEENCQRPRRDKFGPCHLEDYEAEI